MAIPSQSEMFYIVLELVKDLPSFTRGKAKEIVVESLKLSEAEQNEKTSSGVPIYGSRVGWAVSWLSDANYVERISYGTYRITERGKEVLNLNISRKDFTALLREDRLEHMAIGVNEKESDVTVEQEKSPDELLDEAIKTINDQLANYLMTNIMRIEGRAGDTFFEKIVTDLIAKMGYGEGQVTKASKDAGIDGIITTDSLGFDPILIQAKRYSSGNTVGRPEVQAFAGALGAVTRGVFITTSTFSKDAVDFAKGYPHATIVLIDGKKLTELMIEYGVGVSEERSISIKHLDRDYFEI